MRTTLNLDDSLIRAARDEAARRGITLTRLVELGLSLVLERARTPELSAAPVRLPIIHGGVMNRAIDPSSNASWYEHSEREYDLHQAGVLPSADAGA